MSIRPPGVPRINEVPKKMKTFPPRYRGFLEKRYGPEPVIVEVVCRPNPQKEAGGEERHADDESGCGMKAWKTKTLSTPVPRSANANPTVTTKTLWSTLFRRDCNIAYVMPHARSGRAHPIRCSDLCWSSWTSVVIERGH